jgi:hypothetical protein
LAKTYKKYSFSYTYLSNLARENLEEEVYVPYIKDNILKVVAFS